MKSFQKFIILFVFTSSAFANSFTDPHDSTKSYSHPSFVLYSDEPYRSLQAVPSNTQITNTEYWVSLKAEASQQTLPQGETPPETDTSQLTNTVPTNETPLVAPSFSVGPTASVNFQENGSSTVYTALATGADSYAISGGSDSSLFTINTATGILTFSSSPDYENPSDNGSDNSYSVKITATNSGGSSELSLSISVTDDTSDNASGTTFTPGFRRDGTPMDTSIPTYFDVDGYYERNHDVRDAFQDLPGNDKLAWNHYLEYGIFEDRMFDNNFVPLEYLNIYPDLKDAFRNPSDLSIDLNKTVYHWFDYGRAEGRIGRFQMPSWFNASAYMDTHHDVRDALDDDSSFGKDTEAWWHFYRIGAPTEGRSFDDTQFNLDAYIASNADLKEIFKNSDGTYDKKSAMYHYISDGNNEGRKDSFSVPEWFNVNEYRTNNPDVAESSEWNTSDFLIFNHFYRFGAPGENRTLSNFNLTKYIELNQDVSNVFGGARTECMIHYISDGYNEGRKAF